MSNVNAKKSIIGKQLNRRKELIRTLFRSSADGSLGDRYLTEPLPSQSNPPASDEKTVFEVVDTVSRPAIASQQQNQRIKNNLCKLHNHEQNKPTRRSKESQRTSNTRQQSQLELESSLKTHEDARLSEVINRRDFLFALRVMMEVKEHQILEKILEEDETQTVRQFFETEMCFPSYRVMRLLHKAFDCCWDKLLNDCSRFHFPSEITVFLSEKEKAKIRFFDVMLVFPEFIPLSWAGSHIVEISEPLQSSEFGVKFSEDQLRLIAALCLAHRVSRKSKVKSKKSKHRAKTKAQSPSPGQEEIVVGKSTAHHLLKENLGARKETDYKKRRQKLESRTKTGVKIIPIIHKKSSRSSSSVSKSQKGKKKTVKDKKKNEALNNSGSSSKSDTSHRKPDVQAVNAGKSSEKAGVKVDRTPESIDDPGIDRMISAETVKTAEDNGKYLVASPVMSDYAIKGGYDTKLTNLKDDKENQRKEFERSDEITVKQNESGSKTAMQTIKDEAEHDELVKPNLNFGESTETLQDSQKQRRTDDTEDSSLEYKDGK